MANRRSKRCAGNNLFKNNTNDTSHTSRLIADTFASVLGHWALDATRKILAQVDLRSQSLACTLAYRRERQGKLFDDCGSA